MAAATRSDRSPGAPVLTVATVSWNTRELLQACLRAVAPAAGDLPHEIVVVDNGSSDGSAAMVASEFPNVNLIRNPDNRGFASASNQAIARARGQHVLLLNPDAVPPAGSLATLSDYLASHAGVAAVGPTLVDPSGRPGLTYGHFPSLTTALLPLLRPLSGLLPGRPDLHALGVAPPSIGGTTEPREVDYASGAALMLRREAIDQVGGLDEGFFLYFEETDLCLRLRQAGWRVVWHPGVRVVHRGGASRERGSDAALADYYRSLDRYLRKHHGPPYARSVRSAMKTALVLRYVAARAAWRRSQAAFYRASMRALRAVHHA